MLPTLRQLQYLKLLAEHGSFSRAAEAAQLGALMAEVERLLAEDAAAPVATPEAAGDAGGVPESIQDGVIEEDR